MIKSMTLLGSLLLGSASTYAVTNDLPENCAYTRQTVNDISAGEVASVVRDGFALYGNPYDLDAWGSFFESMSDLYNSYDYLRIEAPNHAIRGRNFRVKGNLFDMYAYVNFYNSEKGYLGRDKSNLEANAYYESVRFDQTAGYGLVWITRGGLCNAQGIWVQDAPEVKKVSYSGTWNGGNASVSYSADPNYSKAALDNSNIRLRLKVTKRGTGDFFYTDWETVDSFSGNVNLSFVKPSNWLSSSVDVRAYIDDGYFEDFAVVHAKTAPPNSCPFGPCDIEP